MNGDLGLLAPLGALALLALPCRAQDFNIKCGSQAPSAGYGAATGQSGPWNLLTMPGSGSIVDLQGQPTGATMLATGCDTGACYDCIPSTCTLPGQPDDARLLLSWFNGDCYASGHHIELHGLAPGRYRMHVYSYIGCNPSHSTVHSLTLHEAVGYQTYWSSYFSVGGQPFLGSWSGFPVGVQEFDIRPGATLELAWGIEFGGLCGLQLKRLDDIETVCAGDASGPACPCANTGAPGHGCANSLFPGGALLAASGTPSRSADTVVLAGTDLPQSFGTFIQSTGLSPAPLFDGIRCAGGQILRLSTKVIGPGGFSYPGPGDVPLSVRGGVPAYGGTYYYSASYRNADPSFCPPGTANWTNALRITWAP